MKYNARRHGASHVLVFLLLIVAGAVSAQSSGDGSKVSLRINLVAWGEDIPGLKLKAGGQETTALAFRYSKALSYSGPRILELSQTTGATLPVPPEPEFDPRFDKRPPKNPVPNQVEEMVDRKEIPKGILARREKNPEVMALVPLPTNSRWVTILVAPGSGGTFQTYVIDDDPRKLPKGILRIHNLSRQIIAIRCNKTTRKQLKYGESMMVKPRDEQVLYELAYRKGEKWKMEERNVISVGPRDQVQFIILQSDASFFVSGTGSRTGFLQAVELRRAPEAPPAG